jgi:hypothetical protein
VLLIDLRERSWRERERRKAPFVGMNSSCRHGLTPLWRINRERDRTGRLDQTVVLNFSISDGVSAVLLNTGRVGITDLLLIHPVQWIGRSRVSREGILYKQKFLPPILCVLNRKTKVCKNFTLLSYLTI